MDIIAKNALRNKINDILQSDVGQEQMIKDVLFLTVQNETNEVLEALVRESAICVIRLNHEVLKNSKETTCSNGC